MAAAASAEPFFLDTEAGQRYCLYHPPAGKTGHGGVIYVHPFAEEMNKARRMAAMQARALALLGYGVLQIDLQGCGDSSGDFGDARWAGWKRDLAAAHGWLADRLNAPVHLWGMRLGALLALDYAAEARPALGAIVMWQPVQSGKTYLTQFLRLRVAHDMISDSKDPGQGTSALRARLKAGEAIEIAGYELAPELADAIESLNLADMAPPTGALHWFEAVPAADRPLPPGAARVAAAWMEAGADLRLHVVHCPSFWSTQEVTECQPLLDATTAVFDDRLQ